MTHVCIYMCTVTQKNRVHTHLMIFTIHIQLPHTSTTLTYKLPAPHQPPAPSPQPTSSPSDESTHHGLVGQQHLPIPVLLPPQNRVDQVFGRKHDGLIGSVSADGGEGARPHAAQPLLPHDGRGAVDRALITKGVCGEAPLLL